MSDSLPQQIVTCRKKILEAVLDCLHNRTEYINAIERTARGDIPVTGIALELAPWHGHLGLSLRLTSDFPLGDARFDSASWMHFNFTEGCTAPSNAIAKSAIIELYDRGNALDSDLCDMAHLLFWVGAEALLHPSISQLLNEFDIDAPELTDTFVSSHFEYIVIDPDETISSNYCDLVLSNRIIHRLLGTV